jgi:hypothetical protein
VRQVVEEQTLKADHSNVGEHIESHNYSAMKKQTN